MALCRVDIERSIFSEVNSLLKEGKTPDEVNNLFGSTVVYPNQVKYVLKPIEILNSDKATSTFKKAQKNKWTLDKTLNEIGGFSGYKDLFSPEALSQPVKQSDAEKLSLDLAANYTYPIEIHTSKKTEQPVSEFGDWQQVSNDIDKSANSDYYSNLTVPGGTNYTENEISTPFITPSIKGHASFSTDSGIGWFRSDDQEAVRDYTETPITKDVYDEAMEKSYDESNGMIGEFTEDEETYYVDVDDITRYGRRNDTYFRRDVYEKEKPKTRRILEVQSDLFQKGRDIRSADEIIQNLQKEGKLQIKCD